MKKKEGKKEAPPLIGSTGSYGEKPETGEIRK